LSELVNYGCVKVEVRRAEQALAALKAKGLIAKAKPKRENDKLKIPVLDLLKASSTLSGLGIESEPCEDLFEPSRPSGIPKEIGLSSFIKIGNIVIFSRSSGVPFDAYVRAAQAVTRIYPRLESVFLKVGTVGELRLPQLVLLYGSGSTLTRATENGLHFLVDVAKTYYNPKLAGERLRVSKEVSEGELILDMFAGVAPFSITAASAARCEAVAVDVNPYAAYLAARNVALNARRLKGKVTVMWADSRTLPDVLEGEFDRIIMNNPTSVLDFIGPACALAAKGARLHVYILTGDESTALDLVTSTALKYCGSVRPIGVHRVLEYSPSQSIYSVELLVKA